MDCEKAREIFLILNVVKYFVISTRLPVCYSMTWPTSQKNWLIWKMFLNLRSIYKYLHIKINLQNILHLSFFQIYEAYTRLPLWLPFIRLPYSTLKFIFFENYDSHNAKSMEKNIVGEGYFTNCKVILPVSVLTLITFFSIPWDPRISGFY